MEQAKRRKVEMIAGLVLVVLAFLGNCRFLMDQLKVSNGFDIFFTVFTFLALIIAGIYIGTEFKKSSAKLYKLFLYALTLKLLVDVLSSIDSKDTLSFILSIIGFILLNVLLWVDDLGKMKSIVLSICLFAMDLSQFIYVDFICSPVDANASWDIAGFLFGFAQVTLTLILVMMVHLKYVDKEMRKGSK